MSNYEEREGSYKNRIGSINSQREDYSHGSRWRDEKQNEYMDDHINGVDWHIPNRSDEDDE